MSAPKEKQPLEVSGEIVAAEPVRSPQLRSALHKRPENYTPNTPTRACNEPGSCRGGFAQSSGSGVSLRKEPTHFETPRGWLVTHGPLTVAPRRAPRPRRPLPDRVQTPRDRRRRAAIRGGCAETAKRAREGGGWEWVPPRGRRRGGGQGEGLRGRAVRGRDVRGPGGDRGETPGGERANKEGVRGRRGGLSPSGAAPPG